MYQLDIPVYVHASVRTNRCIEESSGIFKRMKFDLVAKILDGYLLPFKPIATFSLKLSEILG